MKKLYIILLILPLIGLGQDLDQILSQERYTINDVNGWFIDSVVTKKKDNSLFTGILVFYQEDGGISSETQYFEGKPTGNKRGYHENGRLFYTSIVTNKGRIINGWYPNGQISGITKYKDGVVVLEKCWNENGKEIECE